MGTLFDPIDVTFDRYKETSVNTTRTKCNTSKLIQREIENADVPLPSQWDSFIGLGDNKADLARFLSEQLMESAPSNKTVVVAGGCITETDVSAQIAVLMCHHLWPTTRKLTHEWCCTVSTVKHKLLSYVHVIQTF